MTEALGSNDPILEVHQLSNRLERAGSPATHQLDIDDFRVPRGAFVAILGPSGCGKTHLLTIAGLLRRPDSVSSFVLHERCPRSGETIRHDLRWLWSGTPSCDRDTGRPLYTRRRFWDRLRSSAALLEMLRRRVLGFALQNGELLPALTVFENIEMPLRINGVGRRQARQEVDRLLDALKIGSLLSSRRINDISGGQHQRVALARAIAHDPELIFVDEPTAQLDLETAESALELLDTLRHADTTIVMVTHDTRLAQRFATQIVHMAAHELRPDCTVGTIKAVLPNTPESRSSLR